MKSVQLVLPGSRRCKPSHPLRQTPVSPGYGLAYSIMGEPTAPLVKTIRDGVSWLFQMVCRVLAAMQHADYFHGAGRNTVKQNMAFDWRAAYPGDGSGRSVPKGVLSQ